MKNSIMVAIATACLATNAFAAKPSVKYDKFDKTTTVNSATGVTGDHHRLLLTAAFNGSGKLTELDLGAYNTSDDGWQYLKCQTVRFLVDDEAFSVPQRKYDNEVLDGSTVRELMILSPTLAQLDQLAAAKKIEWEVCNDASELRKADYQTLKDFVKAVHDVQDGKAGGPPTKREGK